MNTSHSSSKEYCQDRLICRLLPLLFLLNNKIQSPKEYLPVQFFNTPHTKPLPIHKTIQLLFQQFIGFNVYIGPNFLGNIFNIEYLYGIKESPFFFSYAIFCHLFIRIEQCSFLCLFNCVKLVTLPCVYCIYHYAKLECQSSYPGFITFLNICITENVQFFIVEISNRD